MAKQNSYYIHNEIAIDKSNIETHTFKGTGDNRIELKSGKRVDGNGVEWWIETNGGPRVITLDETDWSISIEQAANMLGEATDELRKTIEEHVWQ